MRKGILLAGGSGTRLYPLTYGVNKHFLQIYDKPMIYYPLSTLMLLGIKDVLIISTEKDLIFFKSLLGNGENFGIHIKYEIQNKPNGIAEAFLIGKKFLNGDPSVLILGDNIFHGNELINKFTSLSKFNQGATLLAYPVRDPERYGVVEFNKKKEILGIQEKPKKPKSNYAITGLYFYDGTASEKALSLKKSSRGELEITDLNNIYLKEHMLKVEIMGRGMAWLDAGTCDSLHDASSYIRTLQKRQGVIIGCPEEIAWRKGWIKNSQLIELSKPLQKNDYGKYLKRLTINSKD